jgi:AmiR/NasT family two-component response regulator
MSESVRIAFIADEQDDTNLLAIAAEALGTSLVGVFAADPGGIKDVASHAPEAVIVTSRSASALAALVGAIEEADMCCGIAVVTSEDSFDDNSMLAKVDAVVMAQVSADQKTRLAIRLGCEAARRKQFWSTKIQELEQQRNNDRTIGHAVEILADQRGIPIKDARHRLRQEARNRRCSMIAVAEIVVDASRILSPNKGSTKRSENPE